MKDDPTRLSDLGGDVKASNTDAWKKALNFYLNICDDVYRWQSPELTEEQKGKFLDLAKQLKDEKRAKQVIDAIERGELWLNKESFSKWYSKIKMEVDKQ